MSHTETIEFSEFKDRLKDLLGPRGVCFRETGKHGWTTVDDILDRKPGGRPGSHWCDAAYVPMRQKLAGHYDFNSGIATFYIPKV